MKLYICLSGVTEIRETNVSKCRVTQDKVELEYKNKTKKTIQLCNGDDVYLESECD